MVHFLVVAYPVQGQINPGIQLSNRLATTVHAVITFSTTTYAHRRLFPHITSPDQAVEEGPITYHPFNDGHTFRPNTADESVIKWYSEFKENGSKSISSLLDNLDSTGRTVDCVLYTFMLPWVAEIAAKHGIPSAEYWIQPAAVFAQYYRAFSQDFHKIIAENGSNPYSVLAFPGMPPFQIRDLSSILNPGRSSDPVSKQVIMLIKEALITSLKSKKKVLVNTCEELERDTISAISDVDLIAIGPVLQNLNSDGDQFRPDEAMYMQWLDLKEKNSVVYVSFGSIAVLKREQVEEVLKGLKANGRPYLMVLRDDSRYEGIEMDRDREENENGMIVSWCSQVNVLRHPSVGCFVTHCGWNSTLESMVSGVPIVGVPQWLDQFTNAMLVDKVWGVGVRGEESESGLFEGEELNRCIELVLGDSERRVRIRKNVEVLKKSAMEAVKEGGSSDRNLKAFVHEISNK